MDRSYRDVCEGFQLLEEQDCLAHPLPLKVGHGLDIHVRKNLLLSLIEGDMCEDITCSGNREQQTLSMLLWTVLICLSGVLRPDPVGSTCPSSIDLCASALLPGVFCAICLLIHPPVWTSLTQEALNQIKSPATSVRK